MQENWLFTFIGFMNLRSFSSQLVGFILLKWEILNGFKLKNNKNEKTKL